MTRPDYDYDAAMKRANACGHNCRCEFAQQGELCDYGESKAERMRDERGCTTIAATLWISLPIVTVMAAATHHYVIAAVLAYIGVVFALLALMHWGARQAQSIGRSQDEALDDWMDPPLIDFDSLPLIDRIAAVEGPKLADEAAVWLWLETRGDAS